MKIKRVIGCDEDKEFVVFELDNGVFATVGKDENVSFSPYWLMHAKWVPFDASGNVPDELLRKTRVCLRRYEPDEAMQRKIEALEKELKEPRTKKVCELQGEFKQECIKQHRALTI